MEKNCMFQYATTTKIIEDTGLITLEEAEVLWDKYLEDCKSKLLNSEDPQMGIWIECENTADYHTRSKEIDYRDCEVIGGNIFKIEKKKIF